MNFTSSACSSKTLLSSLPKAGSSTFIRHRSATAVSKQYKEFRKNSDARSQPDSHKKPSLAATRGREFIRSATSQKDGRSGWRSDVGDMPARPPVDLSYIQDILSVSPYQPREIRAIQDYDINRLAYSEDAVESVRLIAEPGALLEVRKRNGAQLVVLIYAGRTDHSRTLYFTLTSDGQLDLCVADEVTFILPGFIERDHAARVGEQATPTSRKELMARVTAVKKLRDIQKAYQDVYNGLSSKFYSLYNDIAPEDPEAWGEISVEDFLQQYKLDSRNVLTSLAAQAHLLARHDEFLPRQTNYLKLKTFHIRPRSEVARIKGFRHKMSTRPDFLSSFAERAHRYIAILDERRANVKSGEPSWSVQTDIEFTEDDMHIIALLSDSLRIIRTLQSDPYDFIAPAIIKAVGRHRDTINDDDTRQLLIDLGVFAPWQDCVSRRWDIISKDVSGRPGARDATVAETRWPATRSALPPTDLYSSDQVASIRHDFGELPAYVIDDDGAQELDDAISVERDADKPDHIWIHVHIADPTRLIHPDHQLARRAARINETSYFFNATSAMLPTEFVHENGLSLGTEAARGRPERTMSFSGKIAPNGDIVDYRIRAGIVRNLQLQKYDDVDATMGWEEILFSYPFGGKLPPRPVKVYAQADRDAFALMHEAISRRIASRASSDSFFVPTATTDLIVRPTPVPPSLEGSRHPGVITGWPDITFRFQNGALESGSRSVVAESAKVACTVASMFARDRGFPIVRRAMPMPTFKDPSELEFLLRNRNELGAVAPEVFARTGATFNAGYETILPDAHWGLSVPAGVGYARVSSPLRRYMDMVNHWQLKHALAHPDAPPLYSADELQRIIGHPVSVASGRIVERAYIREWSAMYFERYMRAHPELVGGDGDGPMQSVDAVLNTTISTSDVKSSHELFDVSLPKLGVRATLFTRRGGLYPELVPGSVHRVDIVGIDIALKGSLQVKLRRDT